MNSSNIRFCPVCGERLRIKKLACPECQVEFPVDRQLSAYEQLTDENALFLQTFLLSRGNMKEVQERLRISYPTAKKRLDELLTALGLKEEQEIKTEVTMDMRKYMDGTSTKASDIIRNKFYENGGQATVQSKRGKIYVIKAVQDGVSFYCKELPIEPPYKFQVFDVMVDLMIEKGGRALKGNGRNYRLGFGGCTEDTLVGAIGKRYAGKENGDSVYDPVFVLAAVLEWAGIARNGHGFLELTPEYLHALR